MHDIPVIVAGAAEAEGKAKESYCCLLGFAKLFFELQQGFLKRRPQ
jgi:hypothetical protein